MITNTFSKVGSISVLKNALLLVCLLFGYYSKGQIVYSSLHETWTGSNWQNDSQTLNTFSGVNLINALTQTWVTPPGAWANALQIVYTNNPDGTVNQSVTQSWNTSSNSWDNLQRSTFTYNAAKKVLTETSEIWLGMWMNSAKTTNTYDGSGYLVNSLRQNWDFISNNWKNNTQTNYTNNPSGTVNQSIDQTWEITNVWANSERTTYTYTGGDKVSVAISEVWTGSNWLNDTKVTNTYNGSFRITTSLNQAWNVVASLWVNNSQSLYFYDISNNLTEIISQTWSTGTSTWTNATRITFNYSLGIDDFEFGKKIALYPNPSSGEITIKSNDFFLNNNYSITDQTGREIQSGTLNGMETKLDISDMSGGLYFFKVDKLGKKNIKLIKK